MPNYLIDTHTHFDVPEYDKDRAAYVARAWASGVRELVLIGYEARYFSRMVAVKDRLADMDADGVGGRIKTHLAMGLHPLYIKNHSEADLAYLDACLSHYQNIAIAEIGLDTYLDELKSPELYQKQQRFFVEQLTLAKAHSLPVMLHIRKSHADTLALIKKSGFKGGGIAHSFSGGEQEALAFIKLGFKIGITGQITNPNAKKLRRTVGTVFKHHGAKAFVIETDCPDMTPLACQHLPMNEPATLPHVLATLSELFLIPPDELASTLWQNTKDALGDMISTYPDGIHP